MTAAFPPLGPEPRAPHVVRSDIQAGIAALLHDSGSFRTAAERDRLVDAVTARYYGTLRVEFSAHDRTHLMFIVRDCAAADCLNDLVAALADRLGPHDLIRLHQLRDEWNAAANFSDDDWMSLRGVLEPVVLSNTHDLYRRTVREFRRPPAHCTDVWRVFVHLAGLNGGDEHVPPFTLFLALVADQLRGERARPLREVLDRLVQRWGITEMFQQEAYGLVRRASTGERWDPALLIAIDFDRPGHYSVISWTQWEREPGFRRGLARVVSRGGLEPVVQEIVASAEAESPEGAGALRIEFLLPLEMLNDPVEQWSKESDPVDGPVPLYRHYPVVVRSLDRVRDPRRRRAWNQRWRSLCDTPQSATWLASRGAEHRLEEEIQLNARIVTMILSEPPPGRSEGAARELLIAIRTGVPIVIWHRFEPPTPTFVELIRLLLGGGGMAELPDRATELRITTSMNKNEGRVGHGLVLLWDDPSRLPGEFRAPAVSVSDAGEVAGNG